PAGAEGDIICHVLGPFAGWMVMGAMRRAGRSSAHTGEPWRPSQMLLRPAKRSAIRDPSSGIVVWVSPHWLANTTGIPRSEATFAGIDSESGPTWPRSQCRRPDSRQAKFG